VEGGKGVEAVDAREAGQGRQWIGWKHGLSGICDVKPLERILSYFLDC
jgi:hypothetical protein